MNTQDYISSGKLELFVLGELGEREREEVVQMAKLHPEIQRELDMIEDTIFQFDNQTGKAPSESLKSRIMDSLNGDLAPPSEKPIERNRETRQVDLSPWKSYFAAACVMAVVASVAAVYFAVQYYDTDRRFTALLEEQSVLAEDLDQYKVRYESADAQLETLLAGNYERIQMKGEGFEIQKDAKVDVWWDQSSASVYISVNSLSGLEDQFDYQLWAIGDDGPVGIGLVNPGQQYSLQQMEAVASAGAFAITIEPKGGSQSPNLEKLVVLGEVA